MENTFEISHGTFLYGDSDSYFIRNKEGQINKIVKNRFFDGQIVKTTNKHFSLKYFTRVIRPTYVEDKGWFYGENYVDHQGNSGGCGFSFAEDNFTELTEPDSILYAKRFYLNREIVELENKINAAKGNLAKIEYSLSISVEDYKSVRCKCLSCGKLFNRNKTNCNIDKCDDCYPEIKL